MYNLDVRLKVGKEEAEVSWKDGGLFAEGYDLESERIALIRASPRGESLSHALISLYECAEMDTWERDVEIFMEDLKWWTTRTDKWSIGLQLNWIDLTMAFATYLTFHPSEIVLERVAESCNVSYEGWRRLLRDGSEEAREWVLERGKLKDGDYKRRGLYR